MATGRVPTTANSPLTAKGDLFTYDTNQARLPVGNNGETLLADSAATTGLRWQPQFLAGKNKIINGDFAINQRQFTTSTSTYAYGFDRFAWYYVSGTTTATAENFTAGSAPVTGYEARQFQRLAVTGQTGGTAQMVLLQNIEDVRTFAAQTVTVSFWAKAGSGTPKIGVSITQNFGTGGSPSSPVITGGGSVTLNTSWTRYSVTVAVPSIGGKTIGTTVNTSFLQLTLVLSDAANTYGTSVGTQNATFDIWGVQVEAGSVATAFQTATGTLAGELAACQRYLPKTTWTDTIGYAYGTNTAIYTAYFPVTPRVNPTGATISGTSLAYALNTSYTVTPAYNQANTSFGSVTVSSGLTITAGQGSRLTNGEVLWTGCEL